ncbi:hypothetical protein DFJ74DRAFT_687261 [Hyaloraphidium curvatum]|nr:hypothetical protein DFJ74DRAFT_687261 [Hyaloraphidium curvatum]
MKRRRSGSDGQFRRIRADWFLHLPPVFLASPADGAHTFLGRYLMRHLPEVDGILVSYTDLKPVSNDAVMFYDNGYFHFHVSLTLLVFSPAVGSALVGTVTKTSRSHIGLLVHDIFNASIPVDHIPSSGYEYDDQRRCWQERSSGKDVEEGTVIRFRVHSLMHANDMMTITGELNMEGDDGVVGSRPRPSVPYVVPLPPLYEPLAKTRIDRPGPVEPAPAEEGANDGDGPLSIKGPAQLDEDGDRDTLFEGHLRDGGDLKKKKKRKSSGGAIAAETTGPTERPDGGDDEAPAAAPAKPKEPKSLDQMSARDLKKLQRKMERKREKKSAA